MKGLLIYDKEGYRRNEWFVDRLIKSADALGCELKLVIYDGTVDFDTSVDFAIVRTICPGINEYFETHAVPTFNNARTSRIANDKWQTYLFAKDLGLRVMRTSRVTEYSDLADSLGSPFVIKSVDGHGGSEVFLVDNEHKCKEILSNIDIDRLIAQSMCSEPGIDMRVYMLASEILAASCRTSNTDFRSNFSLGGKAEIVDVPSEVSCIAKKICQSLGCDFVGIDFIRHNGEWILNEIEDVVGTRMLYSLTDIDAADEYLKYIVSKVSGG